MTHHPARLMITLLLAGFFIASAQAEHPEQIPGLTSNSSLAKLVFLTIEADKYIVSDSRHNRFVELPRRAKERLLDSAEAKQIVVLVTNQRFTAYSAITQAWSSKRTQPGERLESIRAEDYAALVTTNKRLLSYSGTSGVWIERDRKK